MRFLGRVVGLLFFVALGIAAGLAALALHRTTAGLVLGVGTALAVIWALRDWLPGAGAAFAGGWLVPLLVAVAGRGEGDHAVTSDTSGWLIMVAGGVVLLTGAVWGRAPARGHDSGSVGAST